MSENRNKDSEVQNKLAAMFSASKDEVCIPKIYIDMTGDYKAAAVLDELMFWTLPKRGGKTSLRVYKQGSLWLAVRRADWWDRKRLTERQSDGAISKLIELDLIEKDVFLFDGKPTVHIHIKMSNFVKLYGEKIQELAEEDGDADMIKDISDLYEMMGFPNETVISNLPNGEMLNLPNGDFINSPKQPPNTSTTSLEEKKENSVIEEMKLRNPAKGLEWKIKADEEITDDDLDENKLLENALHAFESDMQLPGNWKWNGATNNEEKVWKSLREFIVEQYKKDDTCFQAYQTWRTQPYARGAMSNLKIKRNPEDFPASWTDFLASYAMYGKKVNTVSTPKLDDNGIVISY